MHKGRRPRPAYLLTQFKTKYMQQAISSYQQQAIDFATAHGLTLQIGMPSRGQHFDEDKRTGTTRYTFPCTLHRGRKRYSFKFGQSVAAKDKKPTMYDILACMQKYDTGTFENFCSEFGYDPDKRSAEKTYKAVCREYAAMARLFTAEELNLMSEIQ